MTEGRLRSERGATKADEGGNVADAPLRGPARKGARVYFAAAMLGQVLALVRFVVLARIIGPEQLGLAATLILTSQFLTSVSDTGSDRFIVQDQDGDSPRVLGLVHAAMTLRGVVIAAALILLAGPLSALYGAPTIQPSLMWLALAPLVAGLAHYGTRQVQRSNDFGPEGVTIIAAEMAALTGTVVAALIVQNHTAVIYGLVLRSLALAVVSHVVSKQPYRWSYARPEAMRFTAFATPLFLNGLLLFLGSQGDRILIASTEGAKALGYYSAILLLIQSPMAAVQRFMTTVHLPPLAAQRDDPARFDQVANRLGGRATLLMILAAAGFTAVGPVATWILYGREYMQPILLFALLSAMHAVRFIRLWPNAVAMSIGRSSLVTLNNTARLLAIPAALGAVALGLGLAGVVAGYIVGELAALAVALLELGRSKTLPLRRELVRIGLASVLLAAICGWAYVVDAREVWMVPLLSLATVMAVAVFVRRERVVIGETLSFAARRLGARR